MVVMVDRIERIHQKYQRRHAEETQLQTDIKERERIEEQDDERG
jgi:hypothetical protein